MRDALAEILPGVEPGQVKLLRGQALKGNAAKAGAVRSTGTGRRLSSSIQKAFEQNPASLVVDFEVLPLATDIDAEQAFLDRTEARLILLSQGGSATSRLDAILTRRFQQVGTALPEGGIRTLMSEPQQVAPKVQQQIGNSNVAFGRHLLEGGSEDSSAEVTSDQDEERTTETQANLAAIAAAALSAMGAAACMLSVAVKKHKQRRHGNGEAVALEGISVTDQ